jgi:hypothetical protein
MPPEYVDTCFPAASTRLNRVSSAQPALAPAKVAHVGHQDQVFFAGEQVVDR